MTVSEPKVEGRPAEDFPWSSFLKLTLQCAESALMRQMMARRAETASAKASMGKLDAAVLYALTRLAAPRLVVESGSYRGVGTAFLLAGMRDAGVRGGRVFGIERDAGCGVGSLIPQELREGFVPLIGDIRDLVGRREALPEAIDLFLHDSSHSYEHQRFELRTFWERLRPGGLLVSHDVHLNASFAELVAGSYVHGRDGRTDFRRTGHGGWLRVGYVGALWKPPAAEAKAALPAAALAPAAEIAPIAEMAPIADNKRRSRQPIAPRLAPNPHLNMLVASLSVGGAERIVLDLVASACEAKRRGQLFVLHDVTPAYTLPAAAPGFQVTPLAALPRAQRLATVAAETLASPTPVVYTHLIRRGDLEVLWRHGVQTVPVVHNSEPGWHDPPAAYDDPHVPFVVAVAESVARQLRERGCRKPVVTLRHELQRSLEVATLTAQREQVRRRHGIREGTLLIGMVGQFKAHKAYTRAVRALAEIRRQRDARLMIVGGWDHAYGAGRLAFAAACRRALELGVMADLVLPGVVQPVEPYYAAMDVFLNTSVYEGFSIAILEALNAGCPVVTADVGGIGELAAQAAWQNLTILAEAADPPAVAAAVLRAAARPERHVPPPRERPDLLPRAWSWMAHYGGARRARPRAAAADVLLVTSNLNPGGAQRSLTNLVCAWPESAPRLAVCVLDEVFGGHFLSQLEAAQVPVVSLRETPVLLDRVEALLETASLWGVHTVCFWNADARLKLMFAKAHQAGGLRLVDVSPGPMYFKELEETAELGWRLSLPPDAYLRRLDAFVAKYQDGLPPAGAGLCPERVHVIPNGVPLAPPPPVAESAPGSAPAAADKSPAPPAEHDPALALVTCCRIAPNKRLDWLLDAMEALLARLPGATLTIVGGVDRRHREYADGLQERVRRSAPLRGAVRFAGEHGDVFRFLPRFRAFVMVSSSQGCPNASLEAMACGLPVVANDDGGTREQIEDGGNGFLVTGRSPEEMAQRVETLLRDPALAGRLGAAARRTARERFSIERMVHAYSEVLNG